MSIEEADLQGFLSAAMPEIDTGGSGGAISTVGKWPMDQLGANDSVGIVSDNAEAGAQVDVTVRGRDAAGALVQEVISLPVTQGLVRVPGTQVFERILQITATAHVGTITIDRNTGGVDVATMEGAGTQGFPVSITKVHSMFFDSASEASPVTRYEKVYMRNGHATLTLNNALVSQPTDPSATLAIAVASAVDDVVAVTDRKTAPIAANITAEGFVPAAATTIGVPGGTVPAGSAIGIWLQMTLLANNPPIRTTFDLQLEGATV